MKYQVNLQEIASVVINGTDVGTSASDILDIPANTVVTGIVYEEIEKCDASKAITLKAKTAHAESGNFVGFTTGASDCVNGYNSAVVTTCYTSSTSGGTASVATSIPSVFFTKAGDTLTISSASALTKGKIRLGLVGFRTGMTAEYASAGTNTASADPYTPPEKK